MKNYTVRKLALNIPMISCFYKYRNNTLNKLDLTYQSNLFKNHINKFAKINNTILIVIN